jgi:transglutaminase-like putative cysteine protease
MNTDTMRIFLQESKYMDFSAPIVVEKARTLCDGIFDDIQKARVAYVFVRDNIPHSFDVDAKVITAKASDVLLHCTGICHAKANLLAALLRSQGIPSGFCFQRLTRAGDDSKGWCVHCYNAVWLDGHWIKLDARGNANGKNARFSLGEPILAFPCRSQYQEYFWPGIYANPHAETMNLLERAVSLQEVLENLPDMVSAPPDAA